MKQTDILVNRELRIYRSAQTRQHWPKRAERVQAIVEVAYPILKDMLDFDPGISIRIAGLKAKNVRGTYNHQDKVATIDYRIMNDWTILEVLCHELVHAEQYHQGRLQNIWDTRSSSWRFEWSGEKTNKGTTYRAYRKQPHEIEAFSRQTSLAREVVVKMGLADPLQFLLWSTTGNSL
jgi:hypothetical protein